MTTVPSRPSRKNVRGIYEIKKDYTTARRNLDGKLMQEFEDELMVQLIVIVASTFGHEGRAQQMRRVMDALKSHTDEAREEIE